MSLKRKLTQDDLRKAMSEHKKKIGAVKKIESPLAKHIQMQDNLCVFYARPLYAARQFGQYI